MLEGPNSALLHVIIHIVKVLLCNEHAFTFIGRDVPKVLNCKSAFGAINWPVLTITRDKDNYCPFLFENIVITYNHRAISGLDDLGMLSQTRTHQRNKNTIMNDHQHHTNEYQDSDCFIHCPWSQITCLLQYQHYLIFWTSENNWNFNKPRTWS